MVDLGVEVTGIKLKHPIMNASGVLASTIEGVKKLVETGVSAIVSKTLTLEEREGYLPPITVPLPIGLLNAVGLANPGIDRVGELLREAKHVGLPFIASIGGRDLEEFLELAVKANNAGVDAIELNLSCPNTIEYGLNVRNPIRDIVENVKSIVDKPVWVKLGFSRELLREAGAALDGGADALVLINTLPAMVIDVYVKKPILTNKAGGLSGPAIHPIAVYSVYTVYGEYECEVIGVGGIDDWIPALEMIMAGARALQIATAFYIRGFNVVREIIDGIRKYMIEEGIDRLEELIGIAHY